MFNLSEIYSVKMWQSLLEKVKYISAGIEKSNDLNGTQIRVLPVCSTVPQPSTLPRSSLCLDIIRNTTTDRNEISNLHVDTEQQSQVVHSNC
jgi:hypothetical protein